MTMVYDLLLMASGLRNNRGEWPRCSLSVYTFKVFGSSKGISMLQIDARAVT